MIPVGGVAAAVVAAGRPQGGGRRGRPGGWRRKAGVTGSALFWADARIDGAELVDEENPGREIQFVVEGTHHQHSDGFLRGHGGSPCFEVWRLSFSRGLLFLLSTAARETLLIVRFPTAGPRCRRPGQRSPAVLLGRFFNGLERAQKGFFSPQPEFLMTFAEIRQYSIELQANF